MMRRTAGVPVPPSEERRNGDDQEKSRQSCQIGRGQLKVTITINIEISDLAFTTYVTNIVTVPTLGKP